MTREIAYPAYERLKDFMQDHPDEDEVLKFAYTLFTYPHMADIIGKNDDISGIAINNYFKTWGVLTQQSFDSIKDLKNKLEAVSNFARPILDLNKGENDPLGTAQYQRWAKKYKERVKSGHGIKGSHLPGMHFFRLGDDVQQFYGPSKPSETVYIQHQHMCKVWRSYKSVSMQQVYDYIANPNGNQKKSVALREVEKPTDVTVPRLDKDAVQKSAAEIPPLEYKQISGFGVDIETGAGRAMAQLASYFLYNATRAAHTHECLEAAQDEIQNANLDVIVRDDPASWWDKKTTRIRLVEPQEMPMMRLVEQFAKLPDFVELDSQAYAVDLDIADHAIKVCGGYYDVLKAYKEALEGERDRLVKPTRTDLPTEIATAGIPQQIEQRINSLELTAQHMVQQAANFGSLAQVIATNRSKLGRIAGMPSAVQIPAMEAIRKFNLYQMRRMQLLGGKVDDAVRNQLNVNGDVFESDILDASPQATRRALSDVFDSIRLDLANFQRGLSKDGERQKEIAREIKEQSIETALEIEI